MIFLCARYYFIPTSDTRHLTSVFRADTQKNIEKVIFFSEYFARFHQLGDQSGSVSNSENYPCQEREGGCDSLRFL
jgi:hypothetical protein